MTNLLQMIFDNINSLTNDYGLTIIAVTMLVNFLMLPLVIKQRKSMKHMQELSSKVQEIKSKYGNNSEKTNKEIKKLYQNNPKSMLGILLLFIQMPIFFTMYRLFTNNIVDVSTKILPWISNLSLPDPYFILPIIYFAIQITPSLLSHYDIIKGRSMTIPKLSKQTVILPIVMTLFFVVKMPAAIGIYFIATTAIQSVNQIVL